MARKRKAPAAQPAAPEEILAFDWPPFVDEDDTALLLRRVDSAARDDAEAKAFAGIVSRAFEDVLELEALYRQVPRVLAGDPDAVDDFRSLLARGERLVGRRARLFGAGPTSLKPLPDGGQSFPCKPRFFVGVRVMYAISLGIEHVSGGDAPLRERYLRVLEGLWERAGVLDGIFRTATAGGPGRDERFADGMRMLVRDTRLEGPPGGDRIGGTGGIDEIDGIDGIGGLDGPRGWPPEGTPPQLWPPRGGGFPRDPREDICAVLDDLCKLLVVGGVKGLRPVPGPSTYVDGLIGISPASACANDLVTLTGTFPPTQPADVVVVIGTARAQVVSWSATQIVIRVPANGSSGCVAFLNTTIESQRLDAQLANQEAFGSIAEGLACMGRPPAGTWPKIPIGPSLVPCVGFNFLAIGPPRIAFFLVNGGTSITVEPGTPLTFEWSTSGAPNVRIQRTSTAGPAFDNFRPPSGSLTLTTPFSGTQPATATYRLTAQNACGVVTADVTVKLDQQPNIGIVRIEVVQSIQTATNSVRLVGGKRTIVRVFVDSGLTNGWNSGAGPNRVAGVTGRLTIEPIGGGTAVNAGPPLNPGGSIVAQSGGGSRGILNDSLNFELPLAQVFDGRRLRVAVFVAGREGQPRWSATSTADHTFTRRGGQEVLPFLIADSTVGVGSRPTLAMFNTSLQGARTRLPISATGFAVNPAILDTTGALESLTSGFGWGVLVNRLATTIFLFPSTPVGGIRCALVPTTPGSPLNGIALARVLLTTPAMVAQAGLPATFAHEMCHLAGADHSNCGGATGIDPRLPANGLIEDIGLDVPTRTLIPVGRGDLMSLCGGQGRWPSIALYDTIMMTAFPI